MYKKQLVFTLVFFLSSYVHAQEKLSYSLQDCIGYALKNSSTIKNAILDEQIQLEVNKEVAGCQERKYFSKERTKANRKRWSAK